MRIVACHVDVQFYAKKKKGSIVKAPFRDRSRQVCGPTAQQAQYSEKLPSNRCNYPQSTVRRQLAEKSTQAQEGCFWVGGWLVVWLVVVGEKRQAMWGKKRTKEKEKTIKGKMGAWNKMAKRRVKETGRQNSRNWDAQENRESESGRHCNKLIKWCSVDLNINADVSNSSVMIRYVPFCYRYRYHTES